MTDRIRYADAAASPGASRPHADQPVHADPTLHADQPVHADRPTAVAGVS